MNQISVFGKKLNKVDFFDFVYDTFVSAEFEEEDSLLSLQLKILYGILDVGQFCLQFFLLRGQCGFLLFDIS